MLLGLAGGFLKSLGGKKKKKKTSGEEMANNITNKIYHVTCLLLFIITNIITLHIVANIIENAIDLFSIPKNSLNPNTHSISRPNIIITGSKIKPSGRSLHTLRDTYPIKIIDITSPIIIFV